MVLYFYPGVYIYIIWDCIDTVSTALVKFYGGARGIMVIVAGYGHGDTSSNPGPD